MRRFVLSLFALLLLTCPVLAADGFREGDWAVGGTYAYASPNADFDDRLAALGLSAEYWVVDDLSLEFQAAVPKGDPGQDTVSFAGRANYGFGPVYIPLEVAYWNTVDSLAFGTGVGFNFLGGPVNLRFQATVHYLEDSDLDDRTALQVQGAVRFKF